MHKYSSIAADGTRWNVRGMMACVRMFIVFDAHFIASLFI